VRSLTLSPARPAEVPAADAASRARRADWPTVVVSMPFMEFDRPSIQLGLLKSIGTAHHFPVQTLHANLDFARQLGAEEYRTLAKHRGRMTGDWLFSVAAFGADAPDPDERLAVDFAGDLAYLGDPDTVRERLLRLRRVEVPSYLDALLDAFDWGGVRVVGFSSTFQQSVASFALARRLKERNPHLVTVFGGANFDGEMGVELVRTVDCIDYAVVGEGDVAFPALLAALADGADPGAVPGVARRVAGAAVLTPPGPPVRRLDDAGPPDYTEYFTRAERLGLLDPAAHRSTWIPIETARGCWWGAKHHCTFCGLNGTTMEFRAKSPDRVLTELATQARRYRSFRFEAVDNILDMKYLTELFPKIVDSGADYRMFYEIKSNVSRDQVRLLARGGVDHIQPGLESLSTRVLGLMRKGVRAAQNVNLLRWSRYYGIDVAWNILWGFPGETAADYAEQAAVMPHLVHLQPPGTAGRIWMERFSPLFTDSVKNRTLHREPETSYRYVYPDAVDLDKVAYFFDYELADALPDEAYQGLRDGVEQWSRAWDGATRPQLTYWYAPGFVQIYDARHPGAEGTYTFHDELAEIYHACVDRPITADGVRDRLDRARPADDIRVALTEFARRGLMFLDGNLALSLALPSSPGR
jgi:ribosomal peptide maturation radical SAM protein 1